LSEVGTGKTSIQHESMVKILPNALPADLGWTGLELPKRKKKGRCSPYPSIPHGFGGTITRFGDHIICISMIINVYTLFVVVEFIFVVYQIIFRILSIYISIAVYPRLARGTLIPSAELLGCPWDLLGLG
jgi:hypothetical protein